MRVCSKTFRKTNFVAGVVLFLLAVVGLPRFVHAALLTSMDPKYLHQIWRMEDGLPNPYVRGVLQSKDGYLWMTTDESVARFDGMHFEEFDSRNVVGRVDRWCVGMCEGS